MAHRSLGFAGRSIHLRARLALALACLAHTGAGGCAPADGNLHDAVRDGDATLVRRIVAAGAPVDEADAAGATPLIRALLARRTEIARLLIDGGAAVDAHAAIQPALLADIVAIDRDEPIRVTPLMIAAMVDDHPILNALLDRGARIDSAGDNDLTALHVAAIAGRSDAVRLLLDRGATVDARTRDGATALDLAIKWQRGTTVALLQSRTSITATWPIDVGGHHTIAAHSAGEPAGDVWTWGTMPVGIAVGADGSVYWSQYRTNTIHRADPDGGNPAVVARVDGPLGLAVDRGRHRLLFVTDRHFPRAIGRMQPGDEQPTVVQEIRTHRPFAIASAANSIFWTESINGRIRRADLDGANAATLYDDGISSVNERPGAAPMSSAGIAVEPNRGLLFWTDSLSGAILRARIQDGPPQVLLSRDDGLVLPTAIAVDAQAGRLYWADPGTESIHSASLSGARPQVFAGPQDGVREPYGLAIDPERRLLYWTDLAQDEIRRKPLDGTRVERFLDLGAASHRDVAPVEDGDPCARATVELRRSFLRRWVKAMRTCLNHAAGFKAVLRQRNDVRPAALTCSGELQRIEDLSRLRSTLSASCEPERAEHWLEDTLQRGAEVVAADFPRAAQWLRDVRPFVAARGAPNAPSLHAALEWIDDLLGRLARGASSPREVRAWTLPATGQTMPFRAILDGSADRVPVSVPDDGSVRAGATPAFVDNGDGTITDVATGLMWEKKCAGCGGLHDVDAVVRRQGAEGEFDLAAWLRAINAEGGAGWAGYSDWRLPTADELLGIVDYERFNPAIGPAFDGDLCGFDCASAVEPQCSCTRLGAYWTDSPHADGGATADRYAVLAFHLGLVWSQPADREAHVRAVRGPAPATPEPRFADNGDGTITDRVTRLVWEKKCACPGTPHDVGLRLTWSYDGAQPTIWDWLAALNGDGATTGGLAGHSDWRIPNVKELATLLAYDRADPTIAEAFAREGCEEVTAPQCSATQSGTYWTSTTFADFPAHAYGVEFSVASIDDRLKTTRQAVRAVRGPLP